VVFATNPLVPAVFGLAGSLIGGAIAGVVSLRVSRQALEGAEEAWIRDSRRQIYDRFLSNAQTLLVACEDERDQHEPGDENLWAAHREMWKAYSVIQTVASRPLVEATRVYAYRLWELEADLIWEGGVLGRDQAGEVAKLVRLARHDTIDAMRKELGFDDSARPGEDPFNPFVGTSLEDAYARSPRPRPSPRATTRPTLP
jgi:hypothetical protein